MYIYLSQIQPRICEKEQKNDHVEKHLHFEIIPLSLQKLFCKLQK